MSLAADDARIRDSLARLAPYARRLVHAAAAEALAIHADMVAVEHVLLALMHDEDCAAHRAVLHAFADPETVALEVLAIAPGVLVVASGSTRPFSTRAVEALRAARRAAVESRLSEVGVELVLGCALDALPDADHALLVGAGLAVPAPSAPPGTPVDLEGPLFRSFSSEAKRVLSTANRLAARERGEESAAISPAHIALAALESTELAGRSGLAAQRARSLLGKRTVDRTPAPARLLPPENALGPFLANLPQGADSLDLLGRVHSGGTPDLSQLFARHKVSAPLLARARSAFSDPSV